MTFAAQPPESSPCWNPGISETVIMKIGGWHKRSVFERYAIVSQTDIAEALKKREAG